MAKPNKLEAFETCVINRSAIKNAPYNPRKISKKQEDNLRALIRKHKLLAPVTWNEQTGNIVGGHQRLKVMDAILKADDYNLTVAKVSMPLGQEVEANVGLNNPACQGEWDLYKLAEIKMDFPEIDFEKDLKFDKFDIDVIFADTDLDDDIFADDKREIKSELERLREIDNMKRLKKQYNATNKNENDSGAGCDIDDDILLIFVFPNATEKRDVTARLDEKPDTKYVKHTKLYDIQNGTYRVFGKPPINSRD